MKLTRSHALVLLLVLFAISPTFAAQIETSFYCFPGCNPVSGIPAGTATVEVTGGVATLEFIIPQSSPFPQYQNVPSWKIYSIGGNLGEGLDASTFQVSVQQMGGSGQSAYVVETSNFSFSLGVFDWGIQFVNNPPAVTPSYLDELPTDVIVTITGLPSDTDAGAFFVPNPRSLSNVGSTLCCVTGEFGVRLLGFDPNQPDSIFEFLGLSSTVAPDALPEPATTTLLVVAAVAMIGSTWRRRRITDQACG